MKQSARMEILENILRLILLLPKRKRATMEWIPEAISAQSLEIIHHIDDQNSFYNAVNHSLQSGDVTYSDLTLLSLLNDRLPRRVWIIAGEKVQADRPARLVESVHSTILGVIAGLRCHYLSEREAIADCRVINELSLGKAIYHVASVDDFELRSRIIEILACPNS